MSSRINNKGYDYVDLDLPSGTLWATMNVGASKPSDCGLYFQWGDIVGYTKGQVGIGKGKKKFGTDWNDDNWRWKDVIKYTTNSATLGLEFDAAHINMGGDWHMPSTAQIQELIDNTTSTWEEMDEVKGILFTSIKDASKSIFIPAVGDAWNGSVGSIGIYGGIWSPMLNEDYIYKAAKYLYFDSSGANLGNNHIGVSCIIFQF